MGQRIERQPSHITSGRIAEFERRPGMEELMHRQREQNGRGGDDSLPYEIRIKHQLNKLFTC